MQNRDHHQVSQSRQHLDNTQPPQNSMPSQQAASSPYRLQHSEESWIEIGSRPSSSSLSSANEEIVTTGLRVQHDSNIHRRRRRVRSASQFVIGTGHRATSAGDASSQEEYEESESESDRVMTSSNEGIGPSPLQHELRRSYSVASSETMSEDDDDDENATAVNYPRSSRRQFEPRPNAFSHPPAAQRHATQPAASYSARRPAVRPSSQRHSYPQHTPYNAVSPHSQADHDEALRASLSTLLSAAAAVRGLPKPGQPRASPGNVSNKVDPTTLRLVPESVALGEEKSTNHEASQYNSSARTTNTSPSEKPKRDVGTRSSSKERRATKKARKIGPLVDEISPTFLTWVVSAGVLVAVSALSFSAGYVIGKETGHAEAMGQLGSVGDAGKCGKEAASELGRTGLGLRRLRWTGGSGVRV